jgi:hypothetical protein
VARFPVSAYLFKTHTSLPDNVSVSTEARAIMTVADHIDLGQFMAGLRRRYPKETEFHQAAYEVAANVLEYIAQSIRQNSNE